MLYSAVQTLITKAYGGNQIGGANQQDNDIVFLSIIVTSILLIVLSIFLGKYLWNNYLVKYVTICEPVDSAFKTFSVFYFYLCYYFW